MTGCLLEDPQRHRAVSEVPFQLGDPLVPLTLLGRRKTLVVAEGRLRLVVPHLGVFGNLQFVCRANIIAKLLLTHSQNMVKTYR
jgi:hypothetical protein